ncbi:DUF2071 domain-containing protein [Sphingobacterium sp. HJSM2_6]|uniref:DUF2071 domain-containing protein n=1 Tax=Sphingobacterium sp. HJSM2_6 TaxID=3366264 RepID=UPI003BC08153
MILKIPTIHGIIERRILINYVAEPEVIEKILPKPFRPKLFNGKAIVGICLIRLKNIKPKGLPDFLGLKSENGAHRFAVEWDEDGETKEGVYIPRRDSNLRLNTLVGGRVFPGKHYYAKFHVQEENNHYHIDFLSSDQTAISIDAKLTDKLDTTSIFKSLDQVSDFFEKGSIGYSMNGKVLEGLQLNVYHWSIKPLEVMQVKSSFFEDEQVFPKGSIHFDHAILMENREHEWKSLPAIPCIS